MLRIRPDHAIAHNSLGKALRAQGRDEQASHHFLRAIELGLESSQTHYDLANLLRHGGDLPRAIHHYRRTLEIDPAHGGAKRALESLHGRAR
jgi:tetratricopeptide (TPR) repeat protein